jgi:hypothetical protein
VRFLLPPFPPLLTTFPQSALQTAPVLDIDVWVSYVRTLLRYSYFLNVSVCRDIWGVSLRVVWSCIVMRHQVIYPPHPPPLLPPHLQKWEILAKKAEERIASTRRRSLAQAAAVIFALVETYGGNSVEGIEGVPALPPWAATLPPFCPMRGTRWAAVFRAADGRSQNASSSAKSDAFATSTLLAGVPPPARAGVLSFLVASLAGHTMWALAAYGVTLGDVRVEAATICRHLAAGGGGGEGRSSYCCFALCS